MAQIQIGQLPLTTTLTATTQIPVENANVTQKIEASALRDFVSVGLTSLSVSGNINAVNLIASQHVFGEIRTPAQPHITQVGTLASLVSAGNVSGLNFVTSGNVYAGYVVGNGSLLTGLPAGYTNANVDAYLPTHTGNITAGNIAVTNTFVASGNARVGEQLYVIGQSVLESTTRVHGNLVAAAETLSTSATTGALVISGAGGLGVGGAVFVAGNINTSSNVNVTANVSGVRATFTSFQGSGALLTNIPNSALVNSAITVNGSSVSLGGAVTIAGGVVSVTGTAFQVTGNVTQGNILLSLPQSIGTANSVQFGSFGVGTPASGTTGEIRATNNITAFYSSDKQFKENIRPIPNALDKVAAIGGKLFDWTDGYIQQHGGADEYFLRKSDFGVIAQDVLAVFPEAVRARADGSLAVDYEKLSALAFAAIAELKHQIDQLKNTNGS